MVYNNSCFYNVSHAVQQLFIYLTIWLSFLNVVQQSFWTLTLTIYLTNIDLFISRLIFVNSFIISISISNLYMCFLICLTSYICFSVLFCFCVMLLDILFPLFRVSAIAPVNIPLAFTMLSCPASHVPGTLFLHFINQSYNSASGESIGWIIAVVIDYFYQLLYNNLYHTVWRSTI